MNEVCTGVLVRFFVDRSFGFITPDAGGSDVFTHKSDLKEDVPVGSRVTYKLATFRGRTKAVDVRRSVPTLNIGRVSDMPDTKAEKLTPGGAEWLR